MSANIIRAFKRSVLIVSIGLSGCSAFRAAGCRTACLPKDAMYLIDDDTGKEICMCYEKSQMSKPEPTPTQLTLPVARDPYFAIPPYSR